MRYEGIYRPYVCRGSSRVPAETIRGDPKHKDPNASTVKDKEEMMSIRICSRHMNSSRNIIRTRFAFGSTAFLYDQDLVQFLLKQQQENERRVERSQGAYDTTSAASIRHCCLPFRGNHYETQLTLNRATLWLVRLTCSLAIIGRQELTQSLFANR